MSEDKSLPKRKLFFQYDTNDIVQWLNERGFNSETIDLLTNSGITGFDLSTFSTKDLKQLNIPIQHDYYLLNKEIRDSIYNDLKITLSFGEKAFTFELERDEPEFSIQSLCSFASSVFGIQDPIYLKTEDNDIMFPKIKIIERLLINPDKYSHLIIVTMNESPIKKDKDKGYSSIGNYSSQKKESDLIPLMPSNANRDGEYNSKKITDPYPYQPIPNQDVPYSSLMQNQQEVGLDKNEGEYSTHNQGINTENYQSYVGKTEERDKDVMYSFPPQDNLIDKPEQDNQFKPKSKNKIKDEGYQSNFNIKDTKSEKESKPQLANKADMNNYKKLYGNYEKNELNIEDNTDDTHQLLQEKDDIKKIASEERNYRVLNENKLDEYQPKQYDKYSSGNYSAMDKFNRFSSRQPASGYQSGITANRNDNNSETGYSSLGYQSKLTPPVQKDNEGAGGYSSNFDLRNKVNDLRSQISSYTRDQKTTLDSKPTNYSDYSKNRDKNSQKPSLGSDYPKTYF